MTKPTQTWMKQGPAYGCAHVVDRKGTDFYHTICGVALSTKWAVPAQKYTPRCPACMQKLDDAEKERIGTIETCKHCGEPYEVESQKQTHCYKPACQAERSRLYHLQRLGRKAQAAYG